MRLSASPDVAPEDVHSLLGRHLRVDGYPMVLDMDRSQGCRLVDARNGRSYIDFFTFFAANPLGQSAFQKGRKEKDPQVFNLTLEAGQTAHFGFRVIIYEGPRTKEQIEEQFLAFSK